MNKQLHVFQRYIIGRAYDIAKRPPKQELQVLVYVRFYKKDRVYTQIRGESRGKLRNLVSLVEKFKPEYFEVELLTPTMQYGFTYYIEDQWMEVEEPVKLDDDQREGVPETVERNPPAKSEADIEAMISKRLAEERNKQRLEYLEKREQELVKEVKELSEENKRLSEDNGEYQKMLANKEGIGYVTGNVGNILESFGLAKGDVLSSMGLGAVKRTHVQQETAPVQAEEDVSGIVEEDVPEEEPTDDPQELQRRDSVRELTQFIRHLHPKILHQIYNILFTIERNPGLLAELSKFIKNYLNEKSKKHENT